MDPNKTVAIVGAGMAGLAAARSLCAKGVSVSLFEAGGKVGGCCATTDIDGYTFNDGAIYLAMPAMLDHLFASLELDRSRLLPLHRMAVQQSASLPDGTRVEIKNGPEVTILSAQGEVTPAGLQEELERFVKTFGPALDLFADDILLHPLSLLHLLRKGWRQLARLRGTVATHLTDSFSSDAVRAAFGGTLLYTGAPPDKQPAASLLGLVSMLRDGCFLPEGGMGRIPAVLSDAVQAGGGHIRLDSPVHRILLKQERVRAIELESGEVIEVGAVISSVSAMQTYTGLLSASDSPAGMMRKVRRSPLSHRGFVLQLGLANAIAARGHNNCVLPWLQDQSAVFEAAQTQWLNYTVPTLTAPELAPAGCSIVEMFPAIEQKLAPEAWSKEHKAEIASRAIERLRREHELDISVSRILSPKEFAHDARLYAGALYGVAPTAGPAALFRHRSPIRGLYLAGQTTWPGFGVIGAGMSGIFAAEALLSHEAI